MDATILPFPTLGCDSHPHVTPGWRHVPHFPATALPRASSAVAAMRVLETQGKAVDAAVSAAVARSTASAKPAEAGTLRKRKV